MSAVNNKTPEAPKGPGVCRNGGSCKYRKVGSCKFVHPDSHGNPSVDHPGKNTKQKAKKSNKSHPGAHVKPKVDAMHAIRVVKPLLAKLDRLRALCQPPIGKDEKVIKGWEMIPTGDMKAAELQMQLADAELKAVVSSIRQGLGMENCKLILPFALAYANTAAGQLFITGNVDCTALPEWASMRTLFDEYRFSGIKIDISPLASSATALNTESGFMGIAYDPTDNTQLGTLVALAELAHHAIFCLPNFAGAGGVITTRPMQFSAHVKPNEALTVASSGVVGYTPGIWKNMPANGANAAYDGAIKFYWTNSGANGANAVATMQYFHISFRSRA